MRTAIRMQAAGRVAPSEVAAQFSNLRLSTQLVDVSWVAVDMAQGSAHRSLECLGRGICPLAHKQPNNTDSEYLAL